MFSRGPEVAPAQMTADTPVKCDAPRIKGRRHLAPTSEHHPAALSRGSRHAAAEMHQIASIQICRLHHA